MRIRSILTKLFIVSIISSTFFLPNLSVAHPHENDEKIEELEKKLDKALEKIEDLEAKDKVQDDDIDALQDDQKEEDKQDVKDAYNDLTDETIGAIPGSEGVLIGKKAAEAIAAEKEYQDKYGETVTGESLSESGSCSGSCSTAPPPYWCTLCRTLHTQTWLGPCEGNVH